MTITNPDLGGAAVRALDQYRSRPVYIVHSTFTGGICSNGAALSSIGVNWVVLNSVLSRNRAIGRGVRISGSTLHRLEPTPWSPTRPSIKSFTLAG